MEANGLLRQIHFLGELYERTNDRHPGSVGGGFAKDLGHFRVAEPELDASDDCLTFSLGQPGEGRFVPIDRLSADGGLQGRRPLVRELRIEFGSHGTEQGPPLLVADTVD